MASAYDGEIAELKAQVKVLRQEAQASRARFDYVTHGLPVGILEMDENDMVVVANDVVKDLFGRDPVAEGMRAYDLMHPDDLAHVATIFFASLEPDHPHDWTMEFRIIRPDGSIRWIRSIGRTQFDDRGTYRGVLATWLDMTDEVTAKSSIERFVSMLNVIQDPVMIIDESNSILFANPAAFDAMPPEAEQTKKYRAPTEEAWAVIADVALPAARRDGHWTGEVESYNRRGRLVPYLVSLSTQRDPLTGKEYVTTISRDITSLKEAEAVLRHEALRDPLTGLPNRRALYGHLEDALARAARDETDAAVLFIDLDDFKPVNDRYGHEHGDAVLTTLAHRISGVVREGQMVARIGGDEFVVVWELVADREHVLGVADRIIQIVAEPVSLDAAEVRVGASIGVAFAHDVEIELAGAAGVGGAGRAGGAGGASVPGTDGATSSPAATVEPGDLVGRADQAVYQAKASGRGRVAIWVPPEPS